MVYYSYIAYPVIALFLIIVVSCIAIVISQRNSRLRAAQRHVQTSRVDPEVVNMQVLNSPLQNNVEFWHSDKCVYGDENVPSWKLNCGGLVCNRCVVNFSSALMSSETICCPSCQQIVYVFIFHNPDPTRQMPTCNIDDLNADVCNICFERPVDRKIECQSTSQHMVCDFCYTRLVTIQKISLCPFCRTHVNSENIHTSAI